MNRHLPPAVLLALGLGATTQEACCPILPCLSVISDDYLGPCLTIEAPHETADTSTVTPCLEPIPEEPNIGPCLVPPVAPAPPPCLSMIPHKKPPNTSKKDPNEPRLSPCLKFVSPPTMPKPEMGPCLSPPTEMLVCLSIAPPIDDDSGARNTPELKEPGSRQAAINRVTTSPLPADILSRIKRG